MKRAGRFLILSLAMALAGAAAADSLDVAKGDSFSGKLTRYAEGVVHFRTKLAANLIVPVDEVVRLATDGPFLVKTKGGAAVEGKLTFERNQFVVNADDKEQTFGLDEVESIEPVKQVNPPAEKPLHLSAESGVLWRFGDDDYADAFGRFRLSTSLDKLLFDSDVFLDRADTDEFPRWLTASTRLRFSPDSLWQPTLRFDFERDTDKALRSRAGLNAGYTRVFPELGLEAEAGLQGETSRWRGEHSDEDLNLRLALRYTRQIFENGSFTNSLSFTPSLINPEQIRARSESALAFPLVQRIQLKLNLMIDYEDYPELQSLPKWRTTVGASFLWDF